MEIIKKEMFPGKWPFKADEAKLSLSTFNALTIRINKKEYALNGVAAVRGYKALDNTVWKDNPEIPGAKMSLSPIIKYGLR